MQEEDLRGAGLTEVHAAGHSAARPNAADPNATRATEPRTISHNAPSTPEVTGAPATDATAATDTAERHEPPQPPALVVGIGASADGLDALQHLVAGLSPDQRTAYVDVQHLSPDHPSLMMEILERHIELSVVRIAATGTDVIADYLDPARNDPLEPVRLARELLIGVTRFLRDPEAFDILIDAYLDALVQRGDPTQALRVWVAGYSTDEEADTLAILLDEARPRTGEQLELTTVAGDRRKILLRCWPYHDAEGRTNDAVLTVTDVTRLRRAERDLQATLDALPEQVCVLDADGVITELNAAWKAFATDNGTTVEDDVRIGADHLHSVHRGAASDPTLAGVVDQLTTVLAGDESACDGTVVAHVDITEVDVHNLAADLQR